MDVTLPIVVTMVWAGDTPMITLTDFAIPSMGTFTARVFFTAIAMPEPGSMVRSAATCSEKSKSSPPTSKTPSGSLIRRQFAMTQETAQKPARQVSAQNSTSRS